MQLVRTRLPILFAALTAVLLAVTGAFADDYTLTGTAVRVKTIAFVDIQVYEISHYMKSPPSPKSKQAVIDADVDKRFSWKMLRTVDAEKIRNALREAYAKNGYGDQGKITSFVDSITKELKEGDNVTIKYDAAKKSTTITSPAGSATVPGEDFMKATWKIWFGNIDQKNLGDELLDRF